MVMDISAEELDTQIRVWMIDYMAVQVLNNFVILYDGEEALNSVAILDSLSGPSSDISSLPAKESNGVAGTRKRMWMAKFAWSIQYAFSSLPHELGQIQHVTRTTALQKGLEYYQLAMDEMEDDELKLYAKTVVDLKVQVLVSALTCTKEVEVFDTLFEKYFPEDEQDDHIDNDDTLLKRTVCQRLGVLRDAHSEEGEGMKSYTKELIAWRVQTSPKNFLARMREMVKHDLAKHKSMLVLLAERTDEMAIERQAAQKNSHFEATIFGRKKLESLTARFFDDFPEYRHETAAGKKRSTAAKAGRPPVPTAAMAPPLARRVSSGAGEQTSSRHTPRGSPATERGGMGQTSPYGAAAMHSERRNSQRKHAERKDTRQKATKVKKGRFGHIKSVAAEVAANLLSTSDALDHTGDDPLDQIGLSSPLAASKTKAPSKRNEISSVVKNIMKRRDSGEVERFTSDDGTPVGTPSKAYPGGRNWIDDSPTVKKRARVPWTEEEANNLVDAVQEYGVGRWRKILADPQFKQNFLEVRTHVDLKDKWRNIEKKGSV